MAEFKTQTPTRRPATSRRRSRSSSRASRRASRYQTLLGATGTGKTATMAWIIEKIGRPALVIAHNKTLAAQLCNEFREFFPHERGRVLRLVLRLLPARGVRPAGRPLHREGLVPERRHRAAAARRDLGALHAPRRRRRRLGLVHLRPRLAGGVARARADPRGGGGARPRRRAAQADRQPVRPQRLRARPRPLPRQGRRRRDPAGERRDRLPHLVLRRRGRGDHALRPADRRDLREARQPRHLAGDRVRHVAADDRARGRRDPRTSWRSRCGCSRRGEDARGAPHPAAHRVRPRDDEGARLLLRDRELLARTSRAGRRARTRSR